MLEEGLDILMQLVMVLLVVEDLGALELGEKEISKHLQHQLQYQHLYNLRDILEDILILQPPLARMVAMEWTLDLVVVVQVDQDCLIKIQLLVVQAVMEFLFLTAMLEYHQLMVLLLQDLLVLDVMLAVVVAVVVPAAVAALVDKEEEEQGSFIRVLLLNRILVFQVLNILVVGEEVLMPPTVDLVDKVVVDLL